MFFCSCGQSAQNSSDNTTPEINLSSALEVKGVFSSNKSTAIWQWRRPGTARYVRYRIIENGSEWNYEEYDDQDSIRQLTFSANDVPSTYTLEIQASVDNLSWSESIFHEIECNTLSYEEIETSPITTNNRPYWYLHFCSNDVSARVKASSLFDSWKDIECKELYRPDNNLKIGDHTLFVQLKDINGEWDRIVTSDTTFFEDRTIRLYSSDEVMSSLTMNPPNTDAFYINVEIGNDFFDPCEIEVHGQSSLIADRHSFEIKLPDKKKIFDEHPIESFFILSMPFDQGYMNEYFSYTLLSELGMFTSPFYFVELEFNDIHQGLYLLTEKTINSIIDSDNDIEFIIRRGYDKDYNFLHYKGQDAKIPEEDYHAAYLELFDIIHTLHGEDLYNKIKSILNIDHYLQYLAFNAFVMNGDYTDELYFYAKPRFVDGEPHPYFDIHAWDYDDLFLRPHYGLGFEDSLVYCSEFEWDVVIANDAFLYRKYLETFDNLLASFITEEKIRYTLDDTYEQLRMFLTRREIYEINSNYGISDSINQLRIFIDQRKQFLIEKRTNLLDQIEAKL